MISHGSVLKDALAAAVVVCIDLIISRLPVYAGMVMLCAAWIGTFSQMVAACTFVQTVFEF